MNKANLPLMSAVLLMFGCATSNQESETASGENAWNSTPADVEINERVEARAQWLKDYGGQDNTNDAMQEAALQVALENLLDDEDEPVPGQEEMDEAISEAAKENKE